MNWAKRAAAGAGAALLTLAMGGYSGSAAVLPTCHGALTQVRTDIVEPVSQIVVERVTAQELFKRSAVVQQTVATKAQLQRVERRSAVVERTIPVLWRKSVPEDVDVLRLRITHRLRSRDTHGAAQSGLVAGTLAHEELKQSALPATLIATPPVEVCRNGGTKVVEGGVILKLHFNGMPSAGRYDVNIETTVELP